VDFSIKLNPFELISILRLCKEIAFTKIAKTSSILVMPQTPPKVKSHVKTPDPD